MDKHKLSEIGYEQLLKLIVDLVWELDKNGVYTYLNPRVKEILGYEVHEVIGRTPFDFMPEAEKEQTGSVFKEKVTKKQPLESLENTNCHKDGHSIMLETRANPIFDAHGQFSGYLGISKDITNVKEVERKLDEAYAKIKEARHQLIQAEKLSAIGQLASGIAHEIRNPLAIITQGVEYLEKEFPLKENKDSFEVLTLVKESIERAAKIVSSLLDFSKKTTLNLQPEDINSILEETLVLIRTQLKSTNITVIMEVKEGLPKILVDKRKLEQVFVNILLNAIQAMPKGGKITIRNYKEVLQKFKEGVGRREGDVFNIGEEVIVIEIEDTGIGIPEENLKRIFEPFFTTDPHRGSGLGLSVSRSIISMHKGLIELASQVGKGTKMTVSLKTAGK